jgi:hypothetical protein
MTGFTSKRQVALDKLDDDDIQVYARPWVGLTGELTRNELLELANTFYTGGFTEREIAFARVVLAKSKEKNT